MLTPPDTARLALAGQLRTHPAHENQRIRSTLKALGLRCSLSRIKLLALLLHAPDDHGLEVEVLHTTLETAMAMAVNRSNTYDTLRRLIDGGVVERTAEHTFRLTPHALELACGALDA